jgi:hypothetical protein
MRKEKNFDDKWAQPGNRDVNNYFYGKYQKKILFSFFGLTLSRSVKYLKLIQVDIQRNDSHN